MDHRDVFAGRLNDLVLKRGIQKKDCAAAIGVTKSAFSQFTTKKAVPSFDTLIFLADYFGVSIDYLVGRSDDPRVSFISKEDVLLLQLPDELLPVYQAAKEKNPENLPQIIETFEKIAEEYHSLSK